MTVKVYSLRNGSKRVADTMLLFNEEDPMVTLTIVPSVSNAVVSFSTGTVVGNACTVKPGTSVSYTITCEGYKSISNTIVVNDNQSINVTLEKEVVKHTLKHSGDSGVAVYTVSVNDVSVFDHNGYSGDTIPTTETLLGSYDEGSTVKIHIGYEVIKGNSIYIELDGKEVATKTSSPWSLDYEFTLTKDSVISFGYTIDTGPDTDGGGF